MFCDCQGTVLIKTAQELKDFSSGEETMLEAVSLNWTNNGTYVIMIDRGFFIPIQAIAHVESLYTPLANQSYCRYRC